MYLRRVGESAKKRETLKERERERAVGVRRNCLRMEMELN